MMQKRTLAATDCLDSRACRCHCTAPAFDTRQLIDVRTAVVECPQRHSDAVEPSSID